VGHHEVPFFVAVEGFARVLASAVVVHCRGHLTSGRASRHCDCCNFEIDHRLPSVCGDVVERAQRTIYSRGATR
jgi:hypothetical protein